jgi:hypothetical protein
MEDSACGCVAGWGFPTQLLLHIEIHVDLHIECLLLLSDFNNNLFVLTNFSSSPQYQIFVKISVVFLGFLQAGRHG